LDPPKPVFLSFLGVCNRKKPVFSLKNHEKPWNF
jgi:hypothetical protein